MATKRTRTLAEAVTDFEAAVVAYDDAHAAHQEHWREGAKLRGTKAAAAAKVQDLQKEIRALTEKSLTL